MGIASHPDNLQAFILMEGAIHERQLRPLSQDGARKYELDLEIEAKAGG